MNSPINPNKKGILSLVNGIKQNTIQFSDVISNCSIVSSIKHNNQYTVKYIINHIQDFIEYAFNPKTTYIYNQISLIINCQNCSILFSIFNSPYFLQQFNNGISSHNLFMIQRFADILKSVITAQNSIFINHEYFIEELIPFIDDPSVSSLFEYIFDQNNISSEFEKYLSSIHFISKLLKATKSNSSTYLSSSLYYILFKCTYIDSFKKELQEPSNLNYLSSMKFDNNKEIQTFFAKAKFWILLTSLLSFNTNQFLYEKYLDAIFEINSFAEDDIKKPINLREDICEALKFCGEFIMIDSSNLDIKLIKKTIKNVVNLYLSHPNHSFGLNAFNIFFTKLIMSDNNGICQITLENLIPNLMQIIQANNSIIQCAFAKDFINKVRKMSDNEHHLMEIIKDETDFEPFLELFKENAQNEYLISSNMQDSNNFDSSNEIEYWLEICV